MDRHTLFSNTRQSGQYQLSFRKATASQGRALRVSEHCPRCGDELVLRDGGQVLACSAGGCKFREPAERRLARLMDRILQLQRHVLALGSDVLEDLS